MNFIKKTYGFITNRPFISIFYLLVLIAVLTPIALYFYNFNYSLSIDQSKWSAFGSYIGGVYGPVVGLASALVYLYTLLEIQSSNKKMLEVSNRTNFINEIKWLCDSLRNNLDTNKYIPNRDVFYNHINNIVIKKCTLQPPGSEKDIKKASVEKFKEGEIVLFENETPLLKEILQRIHSIEKLETKSISKAIVKSVLTNDERYWLECYMQRFWPKDMDLLSNWEEFSYIPKSLHDTLNDPEDFPPV